MEISQQFSQNRDRTIQCTTVGVELASLRATPNFVGDARTGSLGRVRARAYLPSQIYSARAVDEQTFGAAGRRDAVTGHSPNMSKPPVASSSQPGRVARFRIRAAYERVHLRIPHLHRVETLCERYFSKFPTRLPPISPAVASFQNSDRYKCKISKRRENCTDFGEGLQCQTRQRNEKRDSTAWQTTHRRPYLTIKVYRVNDLAYTCVRAKSAAGE